MLLTSQGCVRKLMKGKERSEKLIGRMKKKMRRGENGLVCGKAENDWDAPGNDGKVLPMFCKYLREQTALGKRN